MDLDKLQADVEQMYKARGYDNNASSTLVLGLMEEIGELAQAILLTECNDFVPSERKQLALLESDLTNVSLEVGDCITYLLGLCCKLHIKPYFRWREHGSVTSSTGTY